MAVRAWNEPVSPVMWRIFFESDLPSPTFYVWVDGALVGSTTGGFMDVQVGVGRVAQVDVFDDSGDVPAAFFPSTVTLRWEGTADSALYRVEQWVDSAWRILTQIPDVGSGLRRWSSPPLADGVVHTFRVVPVDGAGRDGVAREFSGVMCRWPDAPDGTVTVEAGEFVIN